MTDAIATNTNTEILQNTEVIDKILDKTPDVNIISTDTNIKNIISTVEKIDFSSNYYEFYGFQFSKITVYLLLLFIIILSLYLVYYVYKKWFYKEPTQEEQIQDIKKYDKSDEQNIKKFDKNNEIKSQ